MRTRAILLIAIGICAIVGISMGIYFSTKSSDTASTGGSEPDGNDGNNGGSHGGDNDSDNGQVPSPSPSPSSTPSPSPTSRPTPNPPSLPDPDEAAYTLHALAIGDWGSTLYKPGSCCNRYRQTGTDTPAYYKDYWSQINIAEILAQSAGRLNPKVIIGHGDNFYWNGVGPGDVTSRFQTTFEEVYNQPELQDVRWISVLGNHDYGGSMYICGEGDRRFRPCRSTTELIDALRAKFTLQSNYQSPRWYMPSQYFKYTIQEGDVSIDIFNVDTNFADSHGARQICCQCYGYARGDDKNCNNVDRGNEYCAGGSTEMYDACYDEIGSWFDDSLRQIERDARASTADWKIVNSHYSPHFHMSPPKMERWYKVLRENNIQVFINGHTHGENHDYATFKTHFFENGAGGGIQSETSGQPPGGIAELSNVWIGNDAPYGFFEISASKQWLRMRFTTFDRNWRFSRDKSAIIKGGTKVDHCWYIPRDGSYGREC